MSTRLKKLVITIICLLIVVLIAYRSITIRKQWELPQKETPQKAQSKTSELPEITVDKKPQPKPVRTEPATPPFTRPERCATLMEKRSKFANKLSATENNYLRDTCRIPISHDPFDSVKVLKWWKDEYGYKDMMWANIDELLDFANYPGLELTGIVGPLKNIALNSQFASLRERAISVLYNMDHKKAIPIIKEALRKEVEERGVTSETRGSEGVVYWTGRYLSEEGEYEYAFPFLMKASVFDISRERSDKRVIPFMYQALNDRDDSIKLDAALNLVMMGERNDKIFTTAFTFLRNTVNMKKGALPIIAMQILGELGDKRAIPILKQIADEKEPYVEDEASQAIKKIEKGEVVK